MRSFRGRRILRRAGHAHELGGRGAAHDEGGGAAVTETRRIGFKFAAMVTVNDSDPGVVRRAQRGC